jgi:DNA-binding MltR family transcriptional regulator
MGWSIVTDHEADAIKSLAERDDRTIAIIAATIVEARLKMVLENAFHRNENIESQFFKSTGPLGMFSNKIDLALLLGLITQEAWRDLKTMKDIRNKFAHNLDVRDFTTQQIRNWCENFKLIEKHFREFEPETTEHVNLVMYVDNLSERLAEPKWRYLLTAMLFSTALLFPLGKNPYL